MPEELNYGSAGCRPRPPVTLKADPERAPGEALLLFITICIASLAIFPIAGYCAVSRGPGLEALRPSGPGMAGFDRIPAEATPVEYRVLLVQNFRSGSNYRPVIYDDSPKEKILPVTDRQIIGGEAEYRKLFKKASARINWSKYRILVVQEFTCYKFTQPDSSCSLAGIYKYEDTLFVKMNISHDGPVQGILQQMEWFSYEYRNLFLLIPAKPAKIEFCFPAVDPNSIDVP